MLTIDINVDGTQVSLTFHGPDLTTGPAVQFAPAPKVLPPPTGVFCADIVERFLEYVNGEGKSPATVTAYRHSLAAFTAWLALDGNPPALAAITPRHIADWKLYQQKTEKARPSTINLRLTAASQLFTWAATEGLITINPAASIKHMDRGRLRPKGLTDDEVARLRAAAQADGDLRNIALIELMLGTGLRVSEVLGLCRGDVVINSDSGLVIVRRAKGGKFREVPLPSAARQAVEQYLAGRDDKAAAPLWLGQRGPLVTARAVDKILKSLGRKADIPHISPHTLRHTFAGRYLNANSDLRGLAALMGHANMNTTMIYTEPSRDDLARRVEQAAGGGVAPN